MVEFDRKKELVLRLKQGERCAFDELVQLHRNQGFAICYNLLGNVEDAKDVLQEAFIKVYLNIKKFKEESKFSTWFYRIVVNCSLDFLRKRKRKNMVFVQMMADEEEKQPEIADVRNEPTTIILNQELARNLDNCIAELPKMQRLCFILKHQQRLSNPEIAQILKCGLPTVKTHLFRAVRALQDKLSKYLHKEVSYV